MIVIMREFGGAILETEISPTIEAASGMGGNNMPMILQFVGGEIMEVKIGDKLRIIYMDGEPRYSGRTGIVKTIDDIGNIHGTWGGLALIPGKDNYEIIDSD